MRLIFEDHKYDIEKIDNVLSFLLSDKDREKGTYIPKCVGYFYNPNIDNGKGKPKGDIVFVLPKVLLSPATDGSDKKETLFNVEPEQLINLDWEKWKECDIKEGNLTKREIFDFIYGFSIWIYRAIEVYRKNLRSKSKSQVEEEEDEDADIETNKSIRVGKSGKKTDNTYMDILLSLVDFHKQHHDYIIYVMKMAHSGFNKINWTRTVTRSMAVIQDGAPLYLNPVNKRKEINFDEELLIIFYSILNYIHEKYGFQIINNPGYTLIKGKMFDSYMNKQGKNRLRKIKYKYFSDTALKLWNLCFAFFDKTSTIQAQSHTTDYLLVNSFHTVFEAMIDELIGDKNLPRDLKIQEGGSRRVDSLYTYKYLMENLKEKEVDMTQKIYHIGDAKYHKRTSKLKDADIPKQFDYATNVVKWHMDLMRGLLKGKDKEVYKDIQLYDDITKGFNIIPNFFVSAKVEDLKQDYDNAKIELTTIADKKDHEQTMFGDQLFDRNTLFALHYDVHFLYVLKQYALDRSSSKAKWREAARVLFRKNTLEYLNNNFNFYQLLISDKDESIKKFVSQFFYVLQGKIFSFEVQVKGNKKRVLVYAERINQGNGTDGDGIEITGITKNDKNKADEDARGTMKLKAPNAVSIDVSIQAIKLGESQYELSDGALQSLKEKLFDQQLQAAIEILKTSGMEPEQLRQILGIETPKHEVDQYVVDEEPEIYNIAEDTFSNEEPKGEIIEVEAGAEVTGVSKSPEDTNDLEEEDLMEEEIRDNTCGVEIWDNADVNENERYTKYLPLYSIRAACGTFNHGDLEEQEGWVDVTEYGIRPNNKMFIVHAEGDSMEDEIHDGDLCVFTRDMGGSREGKIVLVESNNTDSRHVIKEYHSTKVQTEDGWAHDSITLHSFNPEYEDIHLTDEDEPMIVGIYVDVLEQ